jgi:hypothetical protein
MAFDCQVASCQANLSHAVERVPWEFCSLGISERELEAVKKDFFIKHWKYNCFYTQFLGDLPIKVQVLIYDLPFFYQILLVHISIHFVDNYSYLIINKSIKFFKVSWFSCQMVLS